MKKFLSIILTLTVFLLAAVCIGREALSEEMEIYEKTLRLHIPANSDSKSDQAVKIKVRDAILQSLEAPLSDCKTRDEAIEIIQQMTDTITLRANEVLKENGMDYTARVCVTEEYYPEKDYDGLSLPAGNYASLKIELGEAEGKNWWCVLFPQVCVGTAKPEEALAEVGFTASQIRLLTEHEECEYVVKFKLVEVLEGIFG